MLQKESKVSISYFKKTWKNGLENLKDLKTFNEHSNNA